MSDKRTQSVHHAATCPSAVELISDIRNMENKRTLSSSKLSCALIDKKCESRRQKEDESRIRVNTRGKSLHKKSPTWSCISTTCSMVPSSVYCRSSGTLKQGTMSLGPSHGGLMPQSFDALKNTIHQVFGEIVQQLEKRIILHVFPDADVIHYGALNDIRAVIRAESSLETRAHYTQTLDCLVGQLQHIGWSLVFHAHFGRYMVEKYGYGAPAFFYDQQDVFPTYAQLCRLIARKLPRDERIGLMTMLTCLLSLAVEDGYPLFILTKDEVFDSFTVP